MEFSTHKAGGCPGGTAQEIGLWNFPHVRLEKTTCKPPGGRGDTVDAERLRSESRTSRELLTKWGRGMGSDVCLFPPTAGCGGPEYVSFSKAGCRPASTSMPMTAPIRSVSLSSCWTASSAPAASVMPDACWRPIAAAVAVKVTPLGSSLPGHAEARFQRLQTQTPMTLYDSAI